MKDIIRKTLAVALCAITILSTVPLPQQTVYAEESEVNYNGTEYEIRTSGDWQYIVVDKKAVIVRCKSDASAIVVPETLDGCTVSEIGYYTDNYWGSIEGGAFEGNVSMQTVTIPPSVKVIGEQAFKGCVGLQRVLVDEGIEEIGPHAFEDCEFMQTIRFIGNSLKKIDSFAFNNCKALDGVVLPTSVETISERAFSNCTALTEIVIPDSVVTLGGGAFFNCMVLNSAVIGNGVVELPAWYDYWGDSGNYDSAHYGTFENCTNLYSVSIGAGVTEIGTDAFANTGLLSVQIPGNVVTVGNGAFINCAKLKQAVISDGTKTIADRAFMSCSSLETVDLGNTVKTIEDRAFAYNSSLGEIHIPKSVLSLGAACFYDCSSMTKAVIGNGVEKLASWYDYWGDSGNYDKAHYGTFENCTSLSEVSIGDGVTSIGIDTFANTVLKTLTIPDGVRTLGEGFAKNCAALESVDIGNGVISIGAKALHNCKVLKNITIGSGVTTIGDRAFADNPCIKELIIPSNVTSLGTAVCYNDTGLEKCIIGNGVTELTAWYDYWGNSANYSRQDYGAFEQCTSLKDVALGSGITTIGKESFAGTALSSIVIPAKVATLGDGAFYKTNVTKAYFTGHAPSSFGKQIFYNTPGTTTYNIAGKLGYSDVSSYAFVEYTPIKVKFDIGNEVFAIEPNDQLMSPEGGYVIEPISPVARDYLFLGWYHDQEYTRPWNFLNDKVTADTTIYAKWMKTSEAKPEAPVEVKDSENTATTVSVSWKEVSGATSYNVYVNGKLTAQNITGTSYKLAGLLPDSAYEIAVTAVNANGESAESLTKVVYTDIVKTIMGDVTGDGEIKADDALQVLKFVVKLEQPTADQISAGDVNQSGELDANDALMILKYVVKLITSF